jgi:DNA-binding CsgD family transcriptional regulator
MGKSSRLRLGEVRQAMRLVGECRDLGRSPETWYAHALLGARQLLRAKVVIGAIAPPEGFNLHSQLRLTLSFGWDSRALEKAALTHLAGEEQLRDPSFHIFQRIARPNITLMPSRLVPRKVFESSEHLAVRRSVGIEDLIFSQRESADRLATFSFSTLRAPDDTYFSAREMKLMRLLHDELALLVGNVLSADDADPLAGLSPRLRQTLAFLLTGDSEKEIARRMGLSRHTVHDYVGALYKHFRVDSRAALMAHCQQRDIGRSLARPG